MRDAGIVRNRAKIEGTIAERARLARDPGARGLLEFLWDFVDGRPVQNGLRSRADMRRRDRVSRSDLEGAQGARASTSVGPTIVYAFMQAVGMVNDHLVGCFRHAECASAPCARAGR